jgi:rhomboid protease GluP
MADMGITRIIGDILRKGTYEDVDLEQIKQLVQSKEKEYEFQLRAKSPIATYALIAVNILAAVLVYLYAVNSGTDYTQLIYNFGAKVNSNIISGEYYRFITPIFLHANPTHLLINCYSLYALGINVERIFGTKNFLIIYMIAGILGNILSFVFSPAWSVGASGAIFGLLGALLYFGLERPQLFRRFFGYNIIVILFINLAFGFSTTGIDNFAHIGGLIGGFLASGIVSRPQKSRWYLNRLLYVVLTIVVIVSAIAYGFNNGQNEVLSKVSKLESYDKNSDWKNAEITGEQILKSKAVNQSTKSYVLWTLAKAEAISGKYDEAIEHAKMLVQVEPGDGHYILGLLYYDMKRYDLSKEELLAAKKAGAQYDQIDKLLKELK